MQILFVHPNYPAQFGHVAAQRQDACSLLHLYRTLTDLRRSHPALQLGTYRGIEASGDLISFARELGEDRIVVVLNLGTARFELSSPGMRGRVLVSTGSDREGEPVEGDFSLRADEGFLIGLAQDSEPPVRFEIRQAA